MPTPQVMSAALRGGAFPQPAKTAMTPAAIPTLSSANTNGPNPGFKSHWFCETQTSTRDAAPTVTSPMTSRRALVPPANDVPITPNRIAIATMKVGENCAPLRSQSLRLMPPHALRMTATQKMGSEKKRKVVKVTR